MDKRFTEEEILEFLWDADMGVPVPLLCRKHGFTEHNFQQWRAVLVGGRPSLARRLADLERENVQLKRLLADAVISPVRAIDPAQLKWPELSAH